MGMPGHRPYDRLLQYPKTARRGTDKFRSLTPAARGWTLCPATVTLHAAPCIPLVSVTVVGVKLAFSVCHICCV
jgi:hypothetical protein